MGKNLSTIDASAYFIVLGVHGAKAQTCSARAYRRLADHSAIHIYEYFEAFCQRHHTELVVINGENLSPEQELVRDLMAIVTVFSARLHGLRSYRKVLKDAALQKE